MYINRAGAVIERKLFELKVPLSLDSDNSGSVYLDSPKNLQETRPEVFSLSGHCRKM